MTLFDRLVVWIGTPLLAAGLFWGTVAADEDEGTPKDVGGRTLRPDGSIEAAGDPSRPPPGDRRMDPTANPLQSLKVTAAEGTTLVKWDLLKSYEYQEDLKGMTPEIQALDREPVTMVGFLLPLYEFEDIHEFALVGNHWSCCFGQPPTLSGVVTVRLKDGQPGLPNTSEPIRIVGTFHVKELKESGYVISIYSVDGATAKILPY